MNGSHVVEPRKDTGLYNSKLGVWLFLAFEAMFFGALISAYVLLRFAADTWPAPSTLFPLWLGFAHLTLLIAAAFASAQAWAALRVGPVGAYLRWLLVAAGAGLAYVAVAIVQFVLLIADELGPARSTYHGIYFVLFGLLILHIAPAVAYSIGYAIWGVRTRSYAPQLFMNRLECLGLYWQFLALVGLAFFMLFHVL